MNCLRMCLHNELNEIIFNCDQVTGRFLYALNKNIKGFALYALI